MWPSLKDAGRFVWRHRGKFVVATAVAVGVAVYFQWNPETLKEGENEVSAEECDPLDDDEENLSLAMNSRYLVRIQLQFESAGKEFFPTLKIKISECVDVTPAIRQIKELRTANSGSDNTDLEASLWDQIKVASFSLLLVTTYATSALCVLLRVHLYLASRNESLGLSMGEQNSKEIIDNLYDHLFAAGVQNLSDKMNVASKLQLTGWTVKSKVSVSYDELSSVVGRLRSSVEEDMPGLVKLIILRE